MRSYAVLQWDKEGLRLREDQARRRRPLRVSLGPSIVVERSDDPTTGTYFSCGSARTGTKASPASWASNDATRPGSSSVRSSG